LIINDRFVDPIEEGVDVTVRIGALPDSSLIARKLAPARRVLAASPAYLKKYGTLKTSEDLAKHRALTFGHSQAAHRFELTHGAEIVSVPVTSCLCSNNGDVLRAAALHGNGIVMLPTFLIGPDIAAKKLTVVLPDHEPTALGIYAIYAPNRYLAAKTRVFIDFLSGRFGPQPAWDRF